MAALTGWATGLPMVVMAAAFLVGCAAPEAVTSRAPGQAIPSPAAATLSARIPGLQELTGLHPPDIVAMLGQPDLRRDEPPAQLWQYRAADCVLNLFFYREGTGYRLAHAETWQRSLGGSATSARCNDENAPVRAHLVSVQSSL